MMKTSGFIFYNTTLGFLKLEKKISNFIYVIIYKRIKIIIYKQVPLFHKICTETFIYFGYSYIMRYHSKFYSHKSKLTFFTKLSVSKYYLLKLNQRFSIQF